MEISDWLRAIDEQTDIGGKLRILSSWTEQSNRRFSVPLAQIQVKSCNEVRQSSVGVDGLVAPQPESNNDLTTKAIQPTEELEDEDTNNGGSDHRLKPKIVIEKVNMSFSDTITPITNVLINQVDIGVIDCPSNSLKCNINEKVPYVRKLFDRMNVKNLILRSGENIWDPGIDIIMKFEEDVTKGSLMECMISIRNLDPGLCYLDVYGAAGIITQMDCLINNTDVLEATSYANNNELPVGLVTLHFFQFVFGQQGGREFMVEVEMLSRLHHPNLVKLANYYSNHHSSQDLLCYKLVSNGSLESWLHGPLEANCPIDWDNIMKITLGATRGFAYLHEDSQSCVSHGDFKERVKILENTSHLPLAYIAVLVHRLHNVAESLTSELGDNVSHLYKEKVLSLMIPPTPVIDSSDWPFLKVIKGIFEGRLDNIRKADMGEDEGTANFVGQVIQATERNMNDVDELNYDFRNPFVTCGEGGFLAASTQVISCSSC